MLLSIFGFQIDSIPACGELYIYLELCEDSHFYLYLHMFLYSYIIVERWRT